MNQPTNAGQGADHASAAPPQGPQEEEKVSAAAENAASAVSQPETQPAEQKICTDMVELPAALCNLAVKTFVEGATFEDIVETVNECGALGITLQAVQNYFHAHPEHLQERARQLVQSTDQLLAALDKDPDSAEAQLAHATMMTGYMRLHRKTALVTPKDAEYARLRNSNLRMEGEVLRLKVQKAALDRKFAFGRMRYMQHQMRLISERLELLHLQIQKLKGGDKLLGQEALERIKEIYGLVRQPFLPENLDDADQPQYPSTLVAHLNVLPEGGEDSRSQISNLKPESPVPNSVQQPGSQISNFTFEISPLGSAPQSHSGSSDGRLDPRAPRNAETQSLLAEGGDDAPPQA